MQEFDIKGLLQYQLKKDVTQLYKSFLKELEDLRNQHFFMLEKLKRELPVDKHNILRSVNYFDDVEFNYRRKKILDAGNETLRALYDQMDKFEVALPPKEEVNKEQG